jgi:hypothetical protein
VAVVEQPCLDRDLRPIQQLPQHISQNAAVPIIIYFDGRIDPEDRLDFFGFTVLPFDSESDLLPWPKLVV